MTESDVVKTELVSTGDIEDNEIRVTSQGKFRNYIAYATFLFSDKHYKAVVLKGMGRVINKTVSLGKLRLTREVNDGDLAEILKRQVQGLHQLTEIGSVKVVDSGGKIGDDENRPNSIRRLSTIKIVLTTEPDVKLRYQPPLAEASEETIKARNILKGRDPNQGQNVKINVGYGGPLPTPKKEESVVKKEEKVVVKEEEDHQTV